VAGDEERRGESWREGTGKIAGDRKELSVHGLEYDSAPPVASLVVL